MEENKIYEKAIEKWGSSLQILMAIEEMSELTKELTKFFRGKRNYTQIAEEIADVEIMLPQLKYVFANSDEVVKQKIKKLERLEEILGEK